ncbi:hypothetical protein TNCV_4612301 [Trichonephila clavipes]|nr:hypothetical protein TNCV_4612301 [Trichonephila clavipes]
MLVRRIAARPPSATCLPKLRRALPDEWCNIPQDQIDNLIISMPRRLGLRKGRIRPSPSCGSSGLKTASNNRYRWMIEES